MEEVQGKLSGEVAFELRHERSGEWARKDLREQHSKQAEQQVQRSGDKNELTWFEETIVAREEQGVGF